MPHTRHMWASLELKFQKINVLQYHYCLCYQSTKLNDTQNIYNKYMKSMNSKTAQLVQTGPNLRFCCIKEMDFNIMTLGYKGKRVEIETDFLVTSFICGWPLSHSAVHIFMNVMCMGTRSKIHSAIVSPHCNIYFLH